MHMLSHLLVPITIIRVDGCMEVNCMHNIIQSVHDYDTYLTLFTICLISVLLNGGRVPFKIAMVIASERHTMA